MLSVELTVNLAISRIPFICVSIVCTIFLAAGDEVIEWNGRNLRGLLFEEVYDIIFESKQEPQVELIVHRPIR